MPTSYTSLLGLALPVDGELTGTWGQVVNNNITAYLDAAVAGTQIISGTATAVTLSKTTGTTLSQVGSGSTGSSQYQIIRCIGTPASLLTITAPDKTYVIINATAQSVKIVGSGPTTGVTITAGSQAIVAWNGSDFVNLTPPGASGTVTTVSVASANGFTGTVSNPTSTPAITLTTSISGVLKGNGTAISAATAGTDYSAGTSALATGILKSTTSTGALTIAVAADFPTLNQNTTGTAANLTAATTLPSGMTLVAPILGTPSSGTLSSCTVDGTNGVGYINIPQNSQSAAYTLVASDAGKHIFHPSTDANARTFTIPANSSVAYPIGTAISFVNMTSQVVSIAITTDTMYLAGTGTTGTRSLAQYGTATALKIESNKWIISGAGLT
jgi:hypothetical protein